MFRKEREAWETTELMKEVQDIKEKIEYHKKNWEIWSKIEMYTSCKAQPYIEQWLLLNTNYTYRTYYSEIEEKCVFVIDVQPIGKSINQRIN